MSLPDLLGTRLKDTELLAASRSSMFTFADLQTMTFPPRAAYIDGLILEGLTIFGGKPKLGKSWWALRAGLTIATGGIAFGNPSRMVTPARVLYLALEDGKPRLQDRADMLLARGESWPEAMTGMVQFPLLDAGGIDLLADLIDTDGYRVVFIDTLARVRSPRKGKDSYQEDSDAISKIHDLARERSGLSVLLIHHNRKDDHPDDYIDALSGTTGITGVVDHIAVLQRGRGEADAVLRFTSRDAPEHDTAYGFDGGAWTELGSAAEHDLSKARKDTLEALDALGGQARLTEICELTTREKGNQLRILQRLAHEGLVRQEGERGQWKRHNSDNPHNLGS